MTEMPLYAEVGPEELTFTIVRAYEDHFRVPRNRYVRIGVDNKPSFAFNSNNATTCVLTDSRIEPA